MDVMNTRDVRLRWVLRLRWTAIAGEGLVVACCRWGLHVPLPLGPLGVVLAIAAASQVIAWRASRGAAVPPSGLLAAILTSDTLLLTALLYFTGGAHNPFSAVYLIPIAVAASTLGAAWTWTLLSLAVACFAALFWQYVPLGVPGVAHGYVTPTSLHFVGMFAAMSVTGAFLAWFVARLNTEIRERDAALQAAELEAERETRFASIVTLAAGVAHEINSPLSTIAVAARELERDLVAGTPPAALAADAQLIRHEVDRCQDVLGRLRMPDFRGGSEAPSVFRAGEVPGALREMLPAAYGARVVESNRANGAVCRVPRDALLQALGSLVRNAVEASPAGASVRVEVEADAHVAAFTVIDQGPGLAPDVRQRIGEPFVTTKDPGEGTGLGLFLVRRFAREWGGDFAIASVPGSGTRARLELPTEPAHAV
jgi:two-component system, sensor histidine kinase RegB